GSAHEKIQPQQSSASTGSNSAPQSARQRLAKLTASLIGGISADTLDSVTSPTDASGCITVKELEDQLMGVRIREADTVAELKEMRQKVMELETQNHVCTNQLKRQDEELKRLREERDQIIQKAEKWTHSQLRGSSVCDLDDESSSVGAIGSHMSGDAVSINSDELTAIIADLQVRIPELSNDEAIQLQKIEEGSAKGTTVSLTSKDRGKGRISGVAPVEEDGNDTTDSGFQLSDAS
ncbi:unnamed protein product, partial [Gongylonema pulchrum]|uniref:Knl1_RWD_C domain-containing protein n=1 Tax=Gongylonema pulchrum TaxID=637853 RepID=A0A183DTU6_9BILA